MSNVIPFASSARSARLRVGLLRLTDSAPAIVAAELGYLAEEGIEAELSVEPSWANVADKLAHGFLDAAVVLPPLALALALGARGAAVPLIVPMMPSATSRVPRASPRHSPAAPSRPAPSRPAPSRSVWCIFIRRITCCCGSGSRRGGCRPGRGWH
jgi:hypothetical protein